MQTSVHYNYCICRHIWAVISSVRSEQDQSSQNSGIYGGDHFLGSFLTKELKEVDSWWAEGKFLLLFFFIDLKKYQSKFLLSPLLHIPSLPHPNLIHRKGKAHCIVESPRPALLYLGWAKYTSKENRITKCQYMK